jgi:hypothetical protein
MMGQAKRMENAARNRKLRAAFHASRAYIVSSSVNPQRP